MKRSALLLLALLVVWGCQKKETTNPKSPKAKVPPDDVWASMRNLEKFRKEVDSGLTEWNAVAIEAGAKKVSSEIVLFPELYEGIPSDFMQYANILKAKADATADAMKTQDFAQARTNWGAVLDACKGCHVVWKGPDRGYELPEETPRPEPPTPPPASTPTKGKKPKKDPKTSTVQDPFKTTK